MVLVTQKVLVLVLVVIVVVVFSCGVNCGHDGSSNGGGDVNGAQDDGDGDSVQGWMDCW